MDKDTTHSELNEKNNVLRWILFQAERWSSTGDTPSLRGAMQTFVQAIERVLGDEVDRLERHFDRMNDLDLTEWMVSDIFDNDNSWCVLNLKNEIIFGIGWHLTRAQCQALVDRHNKGCLEPKSA